MSSMTAQEALLYATGSDRTGDAAFRIMSASNGMANTMPGDGIYEQHEAVLNHAIADVEQARAEEAAEAAGFDPAFANAQCDCAPGEPCCLRAYEVKDSEDASRKVEWPVAEGQPKRLYLVAKEPHGVAASAKATVILTDKDACRAGTANRPAGATSRIAGGPEFVTDSDDITVTSPFQMPAFNSGMLPREVMVAIYLVGMLLQAKAYRDARPAQVEPSQCAPMNTTALEVFAVPHAKLTASANGAVSATLATGSGFSWGGEVGGSITGEYGNQTLSWSGSSVATISTPQGDQQGPVNHPVFDFIDKIQSSLTGITDQTRRSPPPRTVGSVPDIASISFRMGATVSIPSLELKGKAGSPALEVNCDPFQLELGPTVTGQIDLLGLMLSRVPNGNTIRRALAHDGNALRATAECIFRISGSGTVGMSLLNAVVVEVSDSPNWEQAFSSARTRYSGQVELNGLVSAHARVDVDTWLITASAEAGASAETGFKFGGRATNNSDGTVKFEMMHFFSGITLKAYAGASMGSTAPSESRSSFETGNDETTGSIRTRDTFSATTNAGRVEWERTILNPTGGEDDWYEV